MIEINCKIVKELLPLYVDGVLDEEVASAVAVHLEHCEECMQLALLMEEDLANDFSQEDKQLDYLRKYRNHHKRLRLIISILLLGLILCSIFLVHNLVYGITTTLKGSGKYSQSAMEGIHSPLVVFPDEDIESLSDEFYYQMQDEIFAPICQIYLKKEYSPEQFSKELERLNSIELFYNNQTNTLSIDEEHFCSNAYVALASWNDRFEYALVIENLNTIIYVYLENMNQDALYMDDLFLPSYFMDDNTSSYRDEDISLEHCSFYAFKIGNSYVDCMDLVTK